jgi:23S rRNA (cytidine1920-2'-O)/16S rRNA (cytidine1409-2'-O)-methyltransferase
LGRKNRRPRSLAGELARTYPELENPAAHILEHGVLVDGLPVDNPRSLVRAGARIELRVARPLRGEAKLRAALDAFDVRVEGRVAVDVGAAAGGFTRVLLNAGAARVYAVDAGYGQLVGSLRQDPRVIVLERVNVGDLDTDRVPEPVDLITVDLSYVAASEAMPQLEPLAIDTHAEIIVLVKPMFELGLPKPPSDRASFRAALARLRRALEETGWQFVGDVESPVRGARGAVELLVHAVRCPTR